MWSKILPAPLLKREKGKYLISALWQGGSCLEAETTSARSSSSPSLFASHQLHRERKKKSPNP